MPIKGSLEEASIQDVLQLLSLGRKTGCLSITNWQNLGHVYVAQGRIIFAQIVNRRDRLGDVLVRQGRITQEQLDKAIHLQDQDRGKKIGEILMELGALKQEELERHMRTQIEEAVYFLFGWTQGSFTFEADVEPPKDEVLVSIESESLLLEGARRTDELPRIEKKIPSFGIVFKVDEKRLASFEKSLTSEQKRIAPLLDGSRDVGEVVDQTGLSEFHVAQAVYGLVKKGVARQVSRRHSDRRLSTAGVRLDIDPAELAQQSAVIRHFDDAQLTEYLDRERDYADAKHRREVAFHICDCVECSKRLKELHKRRSVELEAIPVPQPDQTTPELQLQRSGERRTGIDRRLSDPGVAGDDDGKKRRATTPVVRGTAKPAPERRTGIDRRESDRRESAADTTERKESPDAVTLAAGRTSPSKAGPPSGKERRSGQERRQAERRGGDRRSGASVNRKDKYAVERRKRSERREGERRTVTRRSTDRMKMPTGQPGGGAMARRGTPAPAVAVPAQAPKRSARRPAAPKKRPAGKEATKPGVKKKKSVGKDQRPNLRLTEAEQQSLAGLPLIEEPKLASPGTPRTSLPPIQEAKAEPRTVAAEVKPVVGVPVAEKPQSTSTSRYRVAAIVATAVVAVTVGWFGRPIVRSLTGGGESAAVEAAETSPPAVASVAALAEEDSAVTPEVDSLIPQQQPEVESQQAPPTQRTDPAPEQPAQAVIPPARTDPPARADPPAPEAAAPVRLSSLVGTVRSERSGAPLAGIRVEVVGTALATITDASGSFEIEGVQAGSFVVRVSGNGYSSQTQQLAAASGDEVRFNASLESLPTAREPDVELREGQWSVTDFAGAEAVLGRPMPMVAGLWVESIAKPAEGGRRRVRVAQLTPSGERVVLTVTLVGPGGEAAPARVTAIRVRSASGGSAMGTASFGNLLVSARTLLPTDSLRVQLQRLRESSDGQE